MAQTSILNGDSIEDVLLAYYPSPFASPSLSKASSVNGEHRRGSSSGASSARLQMSPVMSRATSRTDGSALDLSVSPPLPAGAVDLDADTPLFSSVSDPREVKITSNSGRLPGGVKLLRGNEGRHNAGTLPSPVFQGPKLRCKMCRRELAARDHVVEHEAGRGQGAFTARKRRKDLGEREREGRTVGSTAADLNAEQKFGARSRAEEASSAASTTDADDAAPAASSSAPAEGAQPPGLRSAASLTASLPPALAALRMGAGAANAAGAGGSRMIHSAACSAYFVEPLAWMENLRGGEVAGRLDCPNTKCGAKLGSWDWAGMQCGW
jgi:dual specificity phosphatase 12